MARQLQNLEYNSFVKGFITEAGPLTFPENATIAEENFVLNKDGSRFRRLGINYEPSFVKRTAPVYSNTSDIVVNTFVWKNAGGYTSAEILVAQVGSRLVFFRADSESISSSIIATYDDVVQETTLASLASVNGTLVVATGASYLITFFFNGTDVFKSEGRLQIRDLFGVEDFDYYTGKDLREGLGISYRPAGPAIDTPHVYNLRNQSFALPRKAFNTENLIDPIGHFLVHTGRFPSNADSVNYALYADPQREENRLVERFFPKDLLDNPPGNFEAAKGFFIIDALDRGPSRQAQVEILMQNNPQLAFAIGTPLKEDTSPEGAKVVQEYAGRIFYGGFGDYLLDGDKYSPRLGSYVLFSQLVKHEANIFKCYQEADPTSNIMSDLVPTDGGTIRVEGAYNIQAMEVVNNKLIVFASNGIWSISGGSDYGFEATNYRVDKISDHGVLGPSSVTLVDGSLLYWGESGIYGIGTDQYGQLTSQNLSSATIQKFYEAIPATQKIFVKGEYDSFRRQVRWVYNNGLDIDSQTSELVFDVGLGAFYINTIKTIAGSLPKVVSVFRTPSFKEVSTVEPVTVVGDPVTVGGLSVELTTSQRQNVVSELKYLVITSLAPLTYTFAYYQDSGFLDWKSEDGTGVDAKAFMITGWTTLGDTQREKVNPYIHFHFNKTEEGFSGDFEPINPSSCLVQAQWEWSNSPNSNRWGRQFQAYRHKRHYIPSDISDKFDNGEAVVTSKNKLRGWGKALSLKIETEAGKDCQILGWSQLIGIETDV